MVVPAVKRETAVRVLQSSALAVVIFLILFLGFFSTLLLVVLLFTPFRYLTILYIIWYVYDWDQSSRGGRKLHSVINFPGWKWACNYFPMRLVKTAELDARYKYIIGIHPHGSIAFGSSCLLLECLGFRQLFPGIDVRVSVLKLALQMPLFREWFMGIGMCDVSRQGIDYVLNRGPGSAVGIVVGGAKELFDMDGQNVKLVLNKRKGFVKVAIQHGACLVPMFTFGENDLYQVGVLKGTRMDRLVRFIQRKVGCCPTIIIGTGLFWGKGLIPHRKPLIAVMGAPLRVERNPTPTQTEIDALHQRYLKELRALFDSHKACYGYPDARISFID